MCSKIGNLGAFGPIVVALVVFPSIYIFFYLINGDVPVERYPLSKISKAQREFMEKLLAANDGTLKGLPRQGSVLRQLGAELYTLASYEEGLVQGTGKKTSVEVMPIGEKQL